MKAYRFIASSYDPYDRNSELGWKPMWMPDANAYEGMAVAHDVLEHYPICKYPPVEEELMAIGAMHYVRAENRWWDRQFHSHVPPEVHMASDIESIWERIYGLREPAQHFDTAPPQQRKVIVYPEAMQSFRRIMEIARNSILDAWAREEGEPPALDVSLEEMERAVNWMYHGYIMARKRYAKCDQYTLSELFTDIMREADRFLRSAEPDDVLVVVPNFKRLIVNIRMEEHAEA